VTAQKPSVKVLFSQPLTFPREFELPDGFYLIGKEAELSWAFARKFPPRISDRMVRLYLIWTILRRGRKGSTVITGRYGEYFALFQGMVPFFRKRHILLDIEWHGSKKNRWLNSFKKIMNRSMARGAAKIGVFCKAEAKNYSCYYGIDENKFFWMPYCSELEEGQFPAAEEHYLFTGGIHQRDYETLFYAVRDIPVTVYVAAPADKIDPRFLSNNMVLLGRVPAPTFYGVMARAKIVVLSLVPGLRRCPGVITYVSAMRLGKAVIVNEPEGAGSYIRNEATGLLVKPRDPWALRDAILRLLREDEIRKQLACNAADHAAKYFSRSSLAAYLRGLDMGPIQPDA
jgi:glycosyltransferase involved in cell wall biosynthesis